MERFRRQHIYASFFVVAVCACLILADAWRSWQARTIQLAETEVAVENLAHGLEVQVRNAIRELDIVLAQTVERVEHDGTSPQALSYLNSILAASKADLPQAFTLFVYDQNGTRIATSESVLPPNLNNSYRDYYDYHRTHEDRSLHVDHPVRSRMSGSWIIPVSRRINYKDGSFAGIAIATLEIDYFLSFFNSLNIGKAGAVAVISTEGFMIARRPFTDDLVGKSMVGTGIYRAYLARHSAGLSVVKSAQDGVTRINSYRAVAGYPLFVTAALSIDEALAAWWKDTLIHSIGILSLVIILGLLGWHLVQKLEERNQIDQEIRQSRTELERLNATLANQAMQDGLTGLANRRYLEMMLGNEYRRAMRHACTIALIMIDVDLFKKFNDTYGHAAGDKCLKAICQAIQKVSSHRSTDLAARYGGEKIAVILPDADVKGATIVAEAIRQAVAELKIPHVHNIGGYVTVSAGIAAFSPQPDTDGPTLLIKAADRALYKAKAEGRNIVSSES